PNATSLQAWDTNFYSELVRAENFDFDTKLLRPYFAFGKVLEGLFEITRELFGVRYEKVSGIPVWHPSVAVYDVVDGDRRIGRFYLDLHPRKDKYTHAAASILVRGIAGTALPQAALMCNFPDPREGPALMEYLDVQRQLVLGALSFEYYHGDPTGVDTTKTLEAVFRRFPLVPFHSGTHFQCNFGHLNGYSAIYYTYMWSLVIAKDLFSKFQEGD